MSCIIVDVYAGLAGSIVYTYYGRDQSYKQALSPFISDKIVR